MAPDSSILVTTSTLSFSCIFVSASGTITFPSRQMREMMKWRWVICDISEMVLLFSAGFTTMYCAMYVLSSVFLLRGSRSEGFTKKRRMNIIARITPTTPSG